MTIPAALRDEVIALLDRVARNTFVHGPLAQDAKRMLARLRAQPSAEGEGADSEKCDVGPAGMQVDSLYCRTHNKLLMGVCPTAYDAAHSASGPTDSERRLTTLIEAARANCQWCRGEFEIERRDVWWHPGVRPDWGLRCDSSHIHDLITGTPTFGDAAISTTADGARFAGDEG